jgi:hypothetical protein
VRAPLGLPAAQLRSGRCSRHLVISDSVLGWLDAPRALLPLQQLVGYVGEQPPAPATISSVPASVEPLPELVLLVQDGVGLSCGFAKGLPRVSLDHACAGPALWPRCGGAPALLVITGDLACLHLAALCGNLVPLVLPRLAEQLEVAAAVRANRLGLVLTEDHSSGGDVSFNASWAEAALNGSGVAGNLPRLAAALRLAGGAPRAAQWIALFMELGAQSFVPLDCQNPLWERWLLDVYAALLLLAYALLLLVRRAARLLDSGSASASNSMTNGNGVHTAELSLLAPALPPSKSMRAFSYERVTPTS